MQPVIPQTGPMAERCSQPTFSGADAREGQANLRPLGRVLIAIAFFLLGLAETLNATGLVIETSPDAQGGAGSRTLVLGGPLQMAAAVLLASGRKTRWALGILLCYAFLASVFANLPQILNSDVAGNATVGLIVNIAAIGILLQWLHVEWRPPFRNSATERRSSASSGLHQEQAR